MRIITGKNKGRRLHTLEGNNTRPMMDRMKENVFNVIGPYLDGGTVLDLFGGSGALSLEALSRGALYSYIIELSNDAIKVINKNIEVCNESNNVSVLQTDYQKALNQFAFQQKQFDYIFIDPPFKLKVIDDVIEFIIKNKLISNNGYIICQFVSGNHNVSEDYLSIIKHYHHSNTEVVIYQNIK